MPARRCVHLGPWGLPARGGLAKAAAAGAEGVEIVGDGELAPRELSATGRRQLRQLAASQRLAIMAVGFAARRGFDIVERLEGRIALAKETLKLAADLGAGMVVANPGTLPKRDTLKQKHFFEALEEIGREALRLGVRFALHLPPEGPAALAELLDGFAQPFLAANYDPALAWAQRHDPVAGLATLGKHLAGVHAKDAVRAGTGLSGCTEVPLGHGGLDYAALAGAAAGVDFVGPWTVVPVGPADDGAGATAYLARVLG